MQTKILAEFALALTYQDLPARAVTMAKQCVEDLIGVALAGSATEQGRIWHTYFSRRTDGLQAAAWMPGFPGLAWREAAALNAACGHLLDMDDVHSGSITHLGVITIPAALAAGSAFHRSGREVIAAIAAGYEVGARVGEAVNPGAYHYWHTTGVVGALATAAAVGKLLGLDDDQYLSAFGSAGTQAAGLWEFLPDGAMSKPLHTGKASYSGVLSAYLSQKGFTAASEILEGEKGFCRAMVKEPHLEKLTENMSTDKLKIDINPFKPYACCKHAHAALYAIQELRKAHSLQSEDIAKIKLYVNDITNYLINNPQPQTPYGGKFSIQYCSAAMLKFGEVGIAQFSEECIHNPELTDLMQRIEVIRDEAMEQLHAADASKLASRVEIQLQNGQTLTMQVDYPKGDPENPLTWEELCAKFMSLAVPVYGEAKALRLQNWVASLEQCSDVAQALDACLKEE